MKSVSLTKSLGLRIEIVCGDKVILIPPSVRFAAIQEQTFVPSILVLIFFFCAIYIFATQLFMAMQSLFQ